MPQEFKKYGQTQNIFNKELKHVIENIFWTRSSNKQTHSKNKSDFLKKL